MRKFVASFVACCVAAAPLTDAKAGPSVGPHGRGITYSLRDSLLRADWKRTSPYFAEISRFVVDAQGFDAFLKKYQGMRRQLTEAEQREIIIALDLSRYRALLAIGVGPHRYQAQFSAFGPVDSTAVLIGGMTTAGEVAAVLGFAAMVAAPVAGVLLSFYGPAVFDAYIAPTVKERCIRYSITCSVIDVPKESLVPSAEQATGGQARKGSAPDNEDCERSKRRALSVAHNNPGRRKIIGTVDIGDPEYKGKGWAKYIYDYEDQFAWVQIHFLRNDVLYQEERFKVGYYKCY